MAIAVRVEVAVLGRRRAGLSERDVVVEVGPAPTLRDLVGQVVASEVAGYERRREERTFVAVLTDEVIADGLVAGAVRSGEVELPAPPPVDDAVATALAAFDDGVYQVFVDDEPIDSLDAVVELREGSAVLFLRLVALAGG